MGVSTCVTWSCDICGTCKSKHSEGSYPDCSSEPDDWAWCAEVLLCSACLTGKASRDRKPEADQRLVEALAPRAIERARKGLPIDQRDTAFFAARARLEGAAAPVDYSDW